MILDPGGKNLKIFDLPQFRNLVWINQKDDLNNIDSLTSTKYGCNPENRPINILLDYGFIPLDKPPGPTSHEVAAWVKRILEIEKTGHSGTLDPGTTGLLPMGLGEATKALSVLLIGPKEYYALGRLHAFIDTNEIKSILQEFKGEIYQRPPQRSSVRRDTRKRSIYELDLLENIDRLVLLRVLCQSGTYVRKLIYDIGEVLGPGATMVELRRTRVSHLYEKNGLVKLHDLYNAYQIYKETKDETKLRQIIQPIEHCLIDLPSVIIRDTAVDALCHGAPLAVPGIMCVSDIINLGNMVAVYTLKGEIVGFADSVMDMDQIKTNAKGIAFTMKRLIMKPNTYPKAWK